MTNIFKGRHFLAEKDFTRAELEWLIDFAAHLKDLKKRNIPHRYLEGKNIALLFEKTSTRTRAAFTVAAIDLGAHPEYLGANDIQLGKKESTEDTAKVLGRMFDGIEFRGFSQKMVEELAEFSGVPVWKFGSQSDCVYFKPQAALRATLGISRYILKTSPSSIPKDSMQY